MRTLSIDLKTRFSEEVKTLPESAIIEDYDSTTHRYTIIFPYSDVNELYKEEGLDFSNLLNKMKKVGIQILGHQSETEGHQSETDLPVMKNFVLSFRDDLKILNPKLKALNEDLSTWEYYVKISKLNISDVESECTLLQAHLARVDGGPKESIDLKFKHCLSTLTHLITRREYEKAVSRFKTIKKELEEFKKEETFVYTREIDFKFQELKKIKEDLIPELRQIDEKNTEIVPALDFIDSFEKYLEAKNNKFIYDHAIFSNDSKKIISAIAQYNVIKETAKEFSKQEEIEMYIFMLTEKLDELEGSVKEILEELPDSSDSE
ncbi:MAG: hypothetical protein KR126chlam5_00045 [Candidatus Anoxychlamydiales bacterium]|nr:hypothetical protein [Candidatus Anoxychlamydiales bacterium]